MGAHIPQNAFGNLEEKLKSWTCHIGTLMDVLAFLLTYKRDRHRGPVSIYFRLSELKMLQQRALTERIQRKTQPRSEAKMHIDKTQ
eukprot:79426-Amphidinium_carterae.1